MAEIRQKITPSLWFDENAEEAMNFYVKTFSDSPYASGESRIISITRYEKGMEAPGTDEMEGKVINGIFTLEGQKYIALDGGPLFKFTEAISFYVECRDQKEVDYFWEKLSAVPEAEACGWLKDKFGLSWQIIPRQLDELAGDKDKEKSMRVINAMLKMKKIIVKDLEKAHKG